ncbi:hypothetical protein H9X57_07065 [Flavobacterium piscinae]|nr:hypothetical protein [Flavobacterium piscinae]
MNSFLAPTVQDPFAKQKIERMAGTWITEKAQAIRFKKKKVYILRYKIVFL